MVMALQTVLNGLGYDAGVVDGVLGRKTLAALAAFQRANGLPVTGTLDEQTVHALLAQAHAGSIASTPPIHASNSCSSGHWVDQVMDGGGFVTLQNGSLWEIDPVDKVESGLWLPTEEIIVCGDGRLINTDNGDQVSATRLR
jgi:hypothetical protein